MHNVFRHGGVDLACKLDEARVFAILSRFPRKVEWIDWDAVTPKAGTRIERHKAKWLRFRGFNDFPDINPHCAVNEFQLITAPTELRSFCHSLYKRVAPTGAFGRSVLFVGLSTTNSSHKTLRAAHALTLQPFN